MKLCSDFFNEVEDEDDPTAEEQITDALARLPPAQQHQTSRADQPQQQPATTRGCDVDELDREERLRVEDFLSVGCGCTGLDGGPCSQRYTQKASHRVSFGV